MAEKILIVGAPGVGKTTLAEEERRRLGLGHFMCTDTEQQARQARGGHPNALYAPSVYNFSQHWSDLSQWVADTWLNNAGPWVIEGVAVYRALRKWHDAHPGEEAPCTALLWPTEPRIQLSERAQQMGRTHDEKLSDLLLEWPELKAVTRLL